MAGKNIQCFSKLKTAGGKSSQDFYYVLFAIPIPELSVSEAAFMFCRDSGRYTKTIKCPFE